MPRSASQFLDAIRPILAEGNPEELARVARADWSAREISGFLTSPERDARQAAAFVLGIIGRADNAGPLMRALHDPDPELVQLAENSLWSIWFRNGSPLAAPDFSRGVALLAQDRVEDARAGFEAALAIDPEFAEAHNQLAICHFIRGRYEDSLRACERVVRLMPTHFGAWAGKGHSHVHLGQVDAAVDSYRRALAIHPGLETISESLRQLREGIPGR